MGIGCAVIFAACYVLFVGLALVGLLRPSRPTAEVAVPGDLAGTWVGTAKERKGEKETWDVRLTADGLVRESAAMPATRCALRRSRRWSIA